MRGKVHFFAKKFGHIKKKQYLCTRFLIERVILEKNGALGAFEKQGRLAQLV